MVVHTHLTRSYEEKDRQQKRCTWPGYHTLNCRVSEGALARHIVAGTKIYNYKTIHTIVHFRGSNRSHTGEALALKIL